MDTKKTIEMPAMRVTPALASAYVRAVGLVDALAAGLTPAARVAFWLWLEGHARKAAAAADEARESRKAVA